MECEECQYYDLYEMIAGGPYGYGGDIPCLRCCNYIETDNDEFIPAEEIDSQIYNIYTTNDY